MKKSNEKNRVITKEINSIVFDFIKDNAKRDLQEQKKSSKKDFILSLRTQDELKDI